MISSVLSPKYQIVIPLPIRRKLNLRPGQSVQFIETEGRLELIPERSITELRGCLKGKNIDFEREGDRV